MLVLGARENDLCSPWECFSEAAQRKAGLLEAIGGTSSPTRGMTEDVGQPLGGAVAVATPGTL